MMGDRYGEVVKVTRARAPINGEYPEIAHVKLDKSSKVTRVLLSDCREV
jgi:hypothetical protein